MNQNKPSVPILQHLLIHLTRHRNFQVRGWNSKQRKIEIPLESDIDLGNYLIPDWNQDSNPEEKPDGELNAASGREKYNGKSNKIADEAEEDIQNSGVFFELKQYCIQLLDLLQNPKKDSSFLSQLLHLLQRSPPQSLQPFMDYTFFPLLLLFDAAVNCRSSVKFDSKDNSVESNTLEMAHKVSDSVAEGVVLCLEEVLKKCHLGSIDQMVVILKKLTHGAMLSPLEASEEFREGVIRCFRAMLLNLCPCSDESCPCKQIGDWPVLPAEKELQFPVSRVSNCNIVSEECLLAFLQSEPASAAIGHWLSLLLKACTAADIEAARGHRGSSRLRVEALITLRVLVAKVGTADALAFYLPGVVGQMGKVLHASRTMISGAAGSTKALDQAVRGLAEFLIIVLEDIANTSILGVPMDEISGLSSRKEKPLASFLEELRHLPLNNTVQDDDVRDSTGHLQRGIIVSGNDSTRVKSDVKSLRVKRTADWLASTTAHVNKLLSAAFPHQVSSNAPLAEVRAIFWDLKASIPVTAARFLDVFALCLSQNSIFAGSLNKLAAIRPSSSGFMHSISEIKAIINADDENSQFFGFQNRKNTYQHEPLKNEYELPSMPPWFVREGSQKLYQALAGILRLVSLYMFTDSQCEGSYSGLIDILLGHLHKLISELRMKEHHKDSWQSWYKKTGSGHLVRQACTAVCILNEMIFGLSDQSITSFNKMFGLVHNMKPRAFMEMVGHLVISNSDYVIDSVCRQLRHLDLNPHVPNVLSAMLSYVGVADKILPLLEEPAVAEIVKASKREAYKLPNQAESYKKEINSKMLNAKKRTGKHFGHSRSYADNSMDREKMDSETDEEICTSGADITEEEWESVLFKFNDSKRYRRIVGSIAGSCLVAVTPLIASVDPAACLTTLNIIEDGIVVLAKVEEAYKHEKETKEAIEQIIQSCSFYHLRDTLGAAEDETGENRLLPAMNKIWPFLVACFRSKNLLHITISKETSNLQRRKNPLQLPYRKSLTSSENSTAETSNLKVQIAVLNMISDLAGNKRSASALEAVFKKISGIVIGIICSGVKGLQDACVNALVGLSSIDPDLIWLLLADVYYSRKKNPPSPPSADFPEISEVLPPPASSKVPFTCCMVVRVLDLMLISALWRLYLIKCTPEFLLHKCTNNCLKRD
ncbi:hypothetical protein DH2020_033090 [Rehmannia glutinosa]|uniref:Uncharacterized protein n=1 Tax=Rehmannia glutinosa TaxID=99300 RepID=A0ABR0VGL7_REHGL